MRCRAKIGGITVGISLRALRYCRAPLQKNIAGLGVIPQPEGSVRGGLSQLVLFHFVAEGVAGDAEQTGGMGLVAVGFSQSPGDQFPFRLLE